MNNTGRNIWRQGSASAALVVALFASAPALAFHVATDIVPNTGPMGGDTPVTINGALFIGTHFEVWFDDLQATDVVRVSETRLTCRTPQANGHSGVEVTYIRVVMDGIDAFVASFGVFQRFTYDNIPRPADITPDFGRDAGGSTFVITGTHFMDGVSVVIGGVPAINVDVIDTFEIHAEADTAFEETERDVPVDVVITNPATYEGLSATLADAYTYRSPLSITSLTPYGGATEGNTLLEITGTNFFPSSVVLMDGVALTSQFMSPTRMRAVTAAHLEGAGELVVHNADGESSEGNGSTADFEFIAQRVGVALRLTIGDSDIVATTIEPAHGPSTGDTPVTIRGVGFTAGVTTVTFGGAVSPEVTFVNATTLIARTPVSTSGESSVVVHVDIDGEGANVANHGANMLFDYDNNPLVTSIVPNFGRDIGGSPIVIHGSGFIRERDGLPGVEVMLGDILATVTDVVDTTEIHLIAEPASLATLRDVPLDVVVTNPIANGGASVLVPDGFTYKSSLRVSSVTPHGGTTEGGTVLEILGTNFFPDSQVLLGGVELTKVYLSATRMRAVTTARVAGLTTLVVHNVDGEASEVNGGSPAYNFIAQRVPMALAVTVGLTAITAYDMIPREGPEYGGTKVIIKGTGFDLPGPVSVTFGDIPALSFVVVDKNTIHAWTPPSTRGEAPVDVHVVFGSEDAFVANTGALIPFLYDNTPHALSITPDFGRDVGNSTFVIRGSGFIPGLKVRLGNVYAAVDPDDVTDTFEIRGLAPPAAADTPRDVPVDVVITNPVGFGAESVTMPLAFTFKSPLRVAQLMPDGGTTLGGVVLDIRGTNFFPDSTVLLGGEELAKVYLSATRMRAVTRSHVAGPATLVVHNADGEESEDNGPSKQFQFLAQKASADLRLVIGRLSFDPPRVDVLEPSSGPVQGGTAFSVTGRDFFPGAIVSVGGRNALHVNVISPSLLTAVSPGTPNLDGEVVSVSVMNTDGQIGTKVNAWTYFSDPTSPLEEVANLEVGIPAYRLAISRDTRKALVTVPSTSSLKIIDIPTSTETHDILLPGTPDCGLELAVTPDRLHALVTNACDQTLIVVDLAAAAVVGSPHVLDMQPAGIAVAPNGTTALVIDDGGCGGAGDCVQVLEATDATWSSVTITGQLDVGDDPRQIVLTPNGLTAFVPCAGSNELKVLEATTLDDWENAVTTKTFSVATAANAIALTNEGSIALLARAGAIDVLRTTSQEDWASGNKVKTFGGMGDGLGVAIRPDGLTAVVSGGSADFVTVLEAAAADDWLNANVSERRDITGRPYSVAIGLRGSRAVVAQFDAGEVTIFSFGPPAPDADFDGMPDDEDNCPAADNFEQEDGDVDDVGDACDDCPLDPDNDVDTDAICGDLDNCPGVANFEQVDTDEDEIGDACDDCPLDGDNDSDNDDICGDVDNCIDLPNHDQADTDGDDPGDICDDCPFDPLNDADGDSRCANNDNCPSDSNRNQDNADGDSLGDLCDDCRNDRFNDIDGDTFCGNVDNCPTDANPGQENTDGDALGDLCDPCVLDPANDADGDGICGTIDNCPTDANPFQENADSDGLGNACDDCPFDSTNDPDIDGVCNDVDNCRDDSNDSQADVDGDGIGDACDGCPLDSTNDTDGDGDCNSDDNCETISNSDQADLDRDGQGDACDDCPNDALNDRDGDGDCGDADNCPGTPNGDQQNSDTDTLGDACDPCDFDSLNDGDHDGKCADVDTCPEDPGPQTDSDGDGDGDVCDDCPHDPDDDVDEDDVCADVDNCDTAPNDQTDSDTDGRGDVCDDCDFDANDDEDGDSLCADEDNCPTDSNLAQTDGDGDTFGDECDACPADADNDADGDHVCADEELCDADPGKVEPGQCGCGVADTDSDSDGTANCNDGCANDPAKTAGGVCGCGVADTDSDGDGTASCNDACPNDANKVAAGACGCGVADGDADSDGTPDCTDGCPSDAAKVAAGTCGCGVSDADSDGDTVVDCTDGCPADAAKTAPGLCGCGVADTDSDGDGTPDCTDGCPNDVTQVSPGPCGCADAPADSDGDGTTDCNDGCPNDPGKTAAGVCGCGVADADPDTDGVASCNDNCDDHANTDQADADSDGVGDACEACATGVGADPDGDLICGSADNCPATSNFGQADFDDDGLGDACDADGDNDAVPDLDDSSDFDPRVCVNTDGDPCDDCASGVFDPDDDGYDLDGDGLCDTALNPRCGDTLCDAPEGCATCSGDCGSCSTPCGNGVCGAGENCVSCSADCGSCAPGCGDHTCGSTETCTNCPLDCGACAAVCGDHTCSPVETCASCAADCGACAPGCGDGRCRGGETCSSCRLDCGSCAGACGDGFCAPGEDCVRCSSDCGACAATCGDGSCGAGEQCVNCPMECGTCASACGDGWCTGTENCSTCAVDCGQCAPGCGNHNCGNGETCSNCSADCGSCPPVCGDNACTGGEDCRSCARDCGVCKQTCGNAACSGEHCVNCPLDCGSCPAVCGNGGCEPGETCTTCSADCGSCTPACGNGNCAPTESCSTCPADCGTCAPRCGDGSCAPTESCTTCAGDCGACAPVCGDHSCTLGEHCVNCPTDCGACPVVCGNGSCEAGENCRTCAGDCGACAATCGNKQCKNETCVNCPDDCGVCQ